MSGADQLASRAFEALCRGDADMVERFAQAISAAPSNLALRIGEAEALFASGHPDPLDNVAAILRVQPGWVAGHTLFATLRWELGERDSFSDSMTAALAAQPANAELWNAYIALLSGAGDPLGAADAARAAQNHFDAPILRLIEAGHAGAAGDLDRAECLLVTLPRSLPGREPFDIRHALRRGNADEAEALLAPLRVRSPADLSVWALTEIVWRLLADARAHWLSGQPGLVATADLGLSHADLTALAETLRGLHRQVAQPIGQSVRGGTQTRGPLFDRNEPAIRQLRDAIQAALETYRAALPEMDAAHPLLRNRARELRVRGGWSVRLVGGGRHVSHLHPAGILSSACYIALPALDPVTQEGWLELGAPPEDLRQSLAALTRVEPKPGSLALFPSYLYHGTRAFGAGERLTVAFDAS